MIIRQATIEEFTTAIKWATDEGWNPGIDDLDVFYKTDPTGFLMGFDEGEPICAISVVKYPESFGFLGFYITRKDKRGQAYGIQIWNAGLNYLQGYTVGLDGVVDQQANYQTSGFELSHRNIRFSGKVSSDFAVNEKIFEIDENLLLAIVEYDSLHFPTRRDSFANSWYSGFVPTRKSKAFIQDGVIKGIGTIRQCRDGYKIGPLFADDSNIALSLLNELCIDLEQEAIFIDVPEPNKQAIGLAENLGFQPVFETARMYLGPIPKQNIGKIFGVTTFELG